MAQCNKVSEAKPDVLNSISSTHMVEGKNQFAKLSSELYTSDLPAPPFLRLASTLPLLVNLVRRQG